MSAAHARVEELRVLHPRDEALRSARRFISILEEANVTERIELGGSLRRGVPFVKDIELVVIPRVTEETDLFGTVIGRRNHFYELLLDLRATGVLQDRLDKDQRPHFGEKSQRCLFQGYALDIFSATEDNFGLIYLLRTGPAKFSKAFVTQHSDGGTYLPVGMRVEGGHLIDRSVKLRTPEERDVFEAIGKEFIAPEDRL